MVIIEVPEYVINGNGGVDDNEILVIDNDNDNEIVIIDNKEYDVSDLSELALLVFTIQGNLYDYSDKSITFRSWMIRFLENYIGTEGGIPMSDVYAIYEVIGVSSTKFKIQDFIAQIIKRIKDWWFEYITKPLSQTWWYDIKIPFMNWYYELRDWEKSFEWDFDLFGINIKIPLFTITGVFLAWFIGIIGIIGVIAFLGYFGFTYMKSFATEKGVIKARD